SWLGPTQLLTLAGRRSVPEFMKPSGGGAPLPVEASKTTNAAGSVHDLPRCITVMSRGPKDAVGEMVKVARKSVALSLVTPLTSTPAPDTWTSIPSPNPDPWILISTVS